MTTYGKLLIAWALAAPIAIPLTTASPAVAETCSDPDHDGFCDQLGPATSRPAAIITDCKTHRAGVTLRIRVRDEGRDGMRIRVSHKDGTGKFHEPKVKRTRTSVLRESKPAAPTGDSEIGTAVSIDRGITKPAFRTGKRWYKTSVTTSFKLRSGVRVTMTCTLPKR